MNSGLAQRLGEAGYCKVRSRFNGDVSLPQFEAVLSAASESPVPRENEVLSDLLELVGVESLPAAAAGETPYVDRHHSLATVRTRTRVN